MDKTGSSSHLSKVYFNVIVLGRTFKQSGVHISTLNVLVAEICEQIGVSDLYEAISEK